MIARGKVPDSLMCAFKDKPGRFVHIDADKKERLVCPQHYQILIDQEVLHELRLLRLKKLESQ